MTQVSGPFWLSGPDLCPICGGDCESRLIPPELTDPLIPLRTEMTQTTHPYIAPHRIIDKSLQQVVYAPGDPMTEEDAIKWGVVSVEEVAQQDKAAEPDASTRRMQAAASKRAAKAAANRLAPEGANRSGKQASIDPSVLPVAEREAREAAEQKALADAREAAGITEDEDEPEDETPVPPKSATKSAWVAYETSKGTSQEDAEAMGLKDYVAKYHGED